MFNKYIEIVILIKSNMTVTGQVSGTNQIKVAFFPKILLEKEELLKILPL